MDKLSQHYLPIRPEAQQGPNVSDRLVRSFTPVKRLVPDGKSVRHLKVKSIAMIMTVGCTLWTVRLKVFLLSLSVLVLVGCFGAQREATRQSDLSAPEAVGNDSGSNDASGIQTAKTENQKSSTTIAAGSEVQNMNEKRRVGDGSHKSPLKRRNSTRVDSGPWTGKGTDVLTAELHKPETAQSEDEYVRTVAIKLADRHPAIDKMRICYNTEDSEWWIFLYQNTGAYYELKQYVWNINLDEPQPFLVVERVSKYRLKKHLYSKEPRRKCKVLDPPKEGWLALLADSDKVENLARKVNRTRTSIAPVTSTKSRPKRTVRRSPTKPKARDTEKRSNVRRPKSHGITESVRARRQRHPRSPSTVATKSKRPREPLRQEVGTQTREHEKDFVATSIGILRNRSRRSIESTSRLSRDAQGKTRSRVLTKRTSKDELSRPAKAMRTSSEASHRFSGSATDGPTGLSPTFRTASAGPRNHTRSSSQEPIIHPDLQHDSSRGTSSVLIRTDQSEQSGKPVVEKQPRPRAGAPTYFVFAYGSKINHPDLLEWLETNGYDSSMVIDATPAVLDGYDFVWNYYSASRGGGAVNLEPKRQSRVWGLLIEFQDPLLRAFDEREGHPFIYSRGEKRVALKRVRDGKTVFAWLYRAKPNKQGRRNIWPTAAYKNKVVEAALFWEFPKEYVRRIKAWKTR